MGVGEAHRACRNCATPLTGPFCAACGQRDLPPDPTLRELAGEAWEAFVSVDGKVVRSVRLLLLRPGTLTTEYLAGRRASFVPPLRLYLVCSVLYFLVSSAIPDVKKTERTRTTSTAAHERGRERRVRDSVARAARTDSIVRAVLDSVGRPAAPGPLDAATRALADSMMLERKVVRELGANPGWLRRQLLPRFVRNAGKVTKDEKTLGRTIRQQMPRLMFFLMPVFAALLAVAYRSRRRRYPTHLIVSLHVHAFAFAVLAAIALAELLPDRASIALTIALGLWMLGYLPLALRRVYGGRLWVATVRSAMLLLVYGMVTSAAVLLTALVAIVLYQPG